MSGGDGWGESLRRGQSVRPLQISAPLAPIALAWRQQRLLAPLAADFIVGRQACTGTEVSVSAA